MLERLVTGLLLGIALFWCGASCWLRGDGVPDWWLPTALVLGAAAASRLAVTTVTPAPRWARAVGWLAIGAACAAVVYGAVATPSRHWDGAASFDAKVFWLVRQPTLLQPFFAEAGVFHHSPDYPLLQPLLVAMTERLLPGCGRLVLPGLYLLLCGIVTAALQRRAMQPPLRVAIALAVALTPALLAPGGGAVDSGYSELLLLLATTTMAAGLLTDRARFLALGALLAVISKPEGLPYALVALAVAFVRGEPRLLWPTFCGIAIALLTWEPVQQVLLHRADFQRSSPLIETLPSRSLYPVLLACAALALVLLDRTLWQERLGRRGRWLLVLGAPLALLLALPWLAPLAAGRGGALALYLQRGDSVYTGFLNLPAYAAAVLDYGVLRLRLGTVLLLPIACAVIAWRRRVRLGDRDLLGFVLLGLLTTALPFVLSPEPDLQHHLRSSLPRLLLHWSGPLWLLAGGWLTTLLRDPAQSSADVPEGEPVAAPS